MSNAGDRSQAESSACCDGMISIKSYVKKRKNFEARALPQGTGNFVMSGGCERAILTLVWIVLLALLLGARANAVIIFFVQFP